jgi:hypothetical protein
MSVSRSRGPGGQKAGRGLVARWWLVAIPLALVAVLLGAFWRPGSIPQANADVVEQIKQEIIPLEGDETTYGISLSLDNTQRFIDYYNEIELTPEQAQVKADALNALKAPCCDDNTMEFC